jgi:hypothetical protein
MRSGGRRRSGENVSGATTVDDQPLGMPFAHPTRAIPLHGDIMKALIAAIVISLLAVAPAAAQTAAPDSTAADQTAAPKAKKAKKAKKKMRRTTSKAKARTTAESAAAAQGEQYREGVTAK